MALPRIRLVIGFGETPAEAVTVALDELGWEREQEPPMERVFLSNKLPIELFPEDQDVHGVLGAGTCLSSGLFERSFHFLSSSGWVKSGRVRIPTGLANKGWILYSARPDVRKRAKPGRIVRPGSHLMMVTNFTDWGKLLLANQADHLIAKAELAADLVKHVDLVLVVVKQFGAWLCVATPDLVAGELTVLAMEANHEYALEQPGPWEDPFVQRATELQIGVVHPSQLDLRVVPEHSPAAMYARRQFSNALGIAGSG